MHDRSQNVGEPQFHGMCNVSLGSTTNVGAASVIGTGTRSLNMRRTLGRTTQVFSDA